MLVFDDVPRDLQGGADHLVSHFDYLNSSGRVEAARVRTFVEDLFGQYPSCSQQDLRRRLRSGDDNAHLGAFFELVLHGLLLRSQCKVLAVEPDLDNRLRSPDFLAETPQGQRFYLEATIATGQSRSQQGANRRLREALQAIDSVRSPDFFLEVHIAGTPAAPVSGARLRRALERWLSDLDYDQVKRLWNKSDEGGHGRPVFEDEQHGARFRILPIPRNVSRGTVQRRRAIGATMPEAQWVQPQEAIRNAVLTKATRYGRLNTVFLIAVNSVEGHADEESAVDALFGTRGVVIRHGESGLKQREVRDGDGVWRGRGGPINKRVSGLLSTEGLTPWNLARRRMRLILNPWSHHPLTMSPFHVDLLAVEQEHLCKTEGIPLGEIFELPESWPE